MNCDLDINLNLNLNFNLNLDINLRELKIKIFKSQNLIIFKSPNPLNLELTSTLILLGISCLLLLILDSLVAVMLWLTLKVTFRKAFLWGLLSLALPPLFFAYGYLVERNWTQVREVEIATPSLPHTFNGYRVVQISDIHLRSFKGRERTLQKMVDKINSLNPDIICFTGDLVTMSPDEIEGFQTILSTLHAKDGVFSVMGNHDYMIYAGKGAPRTNPSIAIKQLQEAERQMGWTLLLDSNSLIRRGSDCIAIVGVENISTSRHFPSKGNLAKALQGSEGAFRILLSHDPTHWDSQVSYRTDIPLTLSGHTHATQCTLLGWCPGKYIYPHYKGHYSQGNQHLYVNIGLGETIFPARVGTRPEITLITLRDE